jgi:hypothetical protein
VFGRQAGGVSREIREALGGRGEGAVGLSLVVLEEMMDEVGGLPHDESEKDNGNE